MKLPLRVASPLLAVMLFLSAAPGRADTAAVEDDATTDTSKPNQAQNGVKLMVSGDANGAVPDRRSFLRFDLSSLPPGTPVDQATLVVWPSAVLGAHSIDVHLVAGDWSESTLTATNAPGLDALVATFHLSQADKSNPVSVALPPAVVADWLGGLTPNLGIAMVASPGADHFSATFNSKENTGTSHAATLEIVPSGSTGGAGGITSLTGGTGIDVTGSGASRTITNTGDTDTADDLTSLSGGTGISISGSGNSRTVTNTGDTNTADDLTSLSGGTGISISGSGNSRTVTNTGDTNTADDLTSLSGGTGISISGSGNSRTVTNTGDTNTADDITSLVAGTGITITGSGNSRTISASAPSDRDLKENFAAVDVREVLDRLVAIPVQTWNYKELNPATRHIGPMAQDFYAAFRVGDDDRHVASLDADGVALAAIQGLRGLLDEKELEIARLKAEQAAQKQRIENLEARLAALDLGMARER